MDNLGLQISQASDICKHEDTQVESYFTSESKIDFNTFLLLDLDDNCRDAIVSFCEQNKKIRRMMY